MPTEKELFEAVDALLEGDPSLPPPRERARLREAAGVTQARLAQALKSSTQTVKNWEAGRSEPRPPRLQAYQRLLEGWAAKYPAMAATPADAEPEPAVPQTFTGPAPAAPAAPPTSIAAEETAAASAAHRQATGKTLAAAWSTSRRPGTKKAARRHDDRFPNGPLAVLDVAKGGELTAYGVGGVLLDCPATTIPALVEWTLTEAGLGAPPLTGEYGKPTDPLVVLTAAAVDHFGLPPALDSFEAKRTKRLPEDHSVVKQITGAGWKLTGRGLGPWARIYRPIKTKGDKRQCVQLAILPWKALAPRAWGAAAQLPPPDLADLLGTYADRVITPLGSTGVCGLELMTRLRPATRAVKDETGAWVSAPNPEGLSEPVDPAPPEARPEHPLAQGWEGGFLEEESFEWVRDPVLLSEEERVMPWAVGLDINAAFLAAAASLTVGLSEPVHHVRPRFDKKAVGCWLVDLSHIELDPRLPNPFTKTGQRPTGPAWYATPTVEYAVQLGHTVEPIEAYLRERTGPYLKPWYDRLSTAYTAAMADVGITKDLDGNAFLAPMALHQLLKGADAGNLDALRTLAAAREALAGPPELTEALKTRGQQPMQLLLADPNVLERLAAADDDALLALIDNHQRAAMGLSAVKQTAKDAFGKLREGPRGLHYEMGERWPALERPTWRPDIRAMVISKARVNMHRKMAKLAELTGAYPLGVLSDCASYPAASPFPADLLPPSTNPTTGRPSGTFRLGVTPGLAKHEGTQTMTWALDLMEQGYNPARHIKGDTADTGE